MQIDARKIENIIRLAAENIVKPKFRNLAEDEILTKSRSDDFVTIADKECEIFITAEILKLYPDAVVIGEESVFDNPNLLNELDGDKIVFVIDPIDGTSNFKNGNENFGIMVAMATQGQTQMGWIYLPMFDKMYFAEKGQGAFFNGNPVKTTQTIDDVSEMFGLGYGEYRFLADNVKSIGSNHCSAVSYVAVLENKLPFIVHYGAVANCWDHMPGILILTEAGGCVKTLDNNDYDYRISSDKLTVSNSCENVQTISNLANVFFKKTT